MKNRTITLYDAARDNELAAVKKFLARKPDGNNKYHRSVNAKNSAQNEATPLFAACQNGHLAMVILLIAHGADIKQGDKDFSPVHIACYHGHHDIALHLLNIDKNAGDRYNKNALLCYAIAMGTMDTFDKLCMHTIHEYTSYEEYDFRLIELAKRFGDQATQERVAAFLADQDNLIQAGQRFDLEREQLGITITETTRPKLIRLNPQLMAVLFNRLDMQNEMSGDMETIQLRGRKHDDIEPLEVFAFAAAQAILEDDLFLLRELFDHYRVDETNSDEAEKTYQMNMIGLIMSALQLGRVKILRWLLEEGKSHQPRVKLHQEDFANALTKTIIDGMADTLDILLGATKDTFVGTPLPYENKKISPLELALAAKRMDIVRVLLKHGANHQHLIPNSAQDSFNATSFFSGVVSQLESAELFHRERLLEQQCVALLNQTLKLTNENSCRWVSYIGTQALAIPNNGKIAEYLRGYLHANDFKTHDFPEKNHYFINKAAAFELMSTLKNKKALWNKFVKRISMLEMIFASSPTRYRIEFTPRALEVKTLEPNNTMTSIMLACGFNLTQPDTYLLKLKTLIGLRDEIYVYCIKLINSERNKHKKFVEKTNAVLTLLKPLAPHIKTSCIDSEWLQLTTDFRCAAIMRPLLRELEFEQPTSHVFLIPVNRIKMSSFDPDVQCQILTSREQALAAFVCAVRKLGQCKVIYQEHGVAVEFKHQKTAILLETLISNGTDYEKIFALDNRALSAINNASDTPQTTRKMHAKTIDQFCQAVHILAPGVKAWIKDEERLVSAPLHPRYASALQSLAIKGLTINAETFIASIDLLTIEAMSPEQLTELNQLAKVAHRKLDIIDEMIRQTWTINKSRFQSDCILFTLKDDAHKNHFAAICGDLLIKMEGSHDQYCVSYFSILALTLDEIEARKTALKTRMKPATPVEPQLELRRAPAYIAPAVRAASTTTLKQTTSTTKKKKKKKQAKPATTPASVTKKKEQVRGPHIAPQPHRDYELKTLKKSTQPAPDYYATLTANPDQTSYVVESPVIKPRKLKAAEPNNADEGSIQHELHFLLGVHAWFDQLESSSKRDIVCIDILNSGTWLALIRLLNAIHLRALADMRCIQISDNEDSHAWRLRNVLLHEFPTPMVVSKLFHALIENGLEAAINCALQGITPKKKLTLREYGDVFFNRKQTIDVVTRTDYLFKCLVKYKRHFMGKLEQHTTSEILNTMMKNEIPLSFAYLIHEVKAMEACLVELGELCRHLNEDTHQKIDPTLLAFMTNDCRRLRNIVTHENAEGVTETFEPLTPNQVFKLAMEAVSLWETCQEKSRQNLFH